jgi:hypothetical protein
MTPTELSLRYLREEGFQAAVVEKWNPHARIRQDLFGFIDILGVRAEETIAVQATSYTNMRARVNKIAEADTVAAVRAAGWTIWVMGWRKVANRWTPTIIDCS